MADEHTATVIVIGVDGSQGSDAAVDWLAQHGAAFDARVTAVHVVSRVDLWDLAAVQVDSAALLEDRRNQLVVSGLNHSAQRGSASPAASFAVTQHWSCCGLPNSETPS